jgi:hypothetical protein
MLMLFVHPLRRFMRLVGACAFLSLIVACTAQSVEKFGIAATPVDDVGACAFMSSDTCPVPDVAPTIRVAHAANTPKTASVPAP